MLQETLKRFRYPEDREFGGTVFKDKLYPSSPRLLEVNEVGDAVLLALAAELKNIFSA